jgi:hypothetical protein
VADTLVGGTAYITNEATRHTISHKFVGELPDCQANAEWIVEDFSITEENGDKKILPFAAFSEFKFAEASFTRDGDVKDGMQGATIMAIQQGGKTLTSCGVEGDNGMACGYTTGAQEGVRR